MNDLQYSNIMLKLEALEFQINKLEKEIQELKPKSNTTIGKASTGCLACGKFDCLSHQSGMMCHSRPEYIGAHNPRGALANLPSRRA